jgi:hypothetical protein
MVAGARAGCRVVVQNRGVDGESLRLKCTRPSSADGMVVALCCSPLVASIHEACMANSRKFEGVPIRLGYARVDMYQAERRLLPTLYQPYFRPRSLGRSPGRSYDTLVCNYQDPLRQSRGSSHNSPSPSRARSHRGIQQKQRSIGTRELNPSFNHEARVTIISMDSINTSEQNRPFSPLTMID